MKQVGQKHQRSNRSTDIGASMSSLNGRVKVLKVKLKVKTKNVAFCF